WFILLPESRLMERHASPPEPLPELSTLVLRQGVMEILEDPRRSILEKEALPAYLPKRRWYAAKNEKLRSTRIVQATLLPAAVSRPHVMPTMLAEIEAVTSGGTHRYLLPLGYIREDD